MAKVLMTNSFRGGTGKSTIISNMAYTIASLGRRVIIIDADVISPGVHAIFGLDKKNFSQTLTDFLLRGTDINDAVYDISSSIGLPEKSLFIVPSSIHDAHIVELLKETENFEKVGKALDKIREEFEPDFILIDTHPGLNEQFLIATGFTDILLSVIRPDNQDYQGAQVTAEISKKVDLKTYLIINKVHHKEKKKLLRSNIEKAFGLPIGGMLPFSEDIVLSQSQFIFTERYPEHEFSREIHGIVGRILGIKPKEHLEIMHDILDEVLTKEKIRLAEISCRDIPVAMFKRHINDFLKDGFIKAIKDGEGKETVSITEKGKKFLARYKVIRKFVDNFRL